ncbi:MAG: methyltransferase [Eubacteriales bacterium]|nr:methyltransferase [Eubacteriales bacterium]
MALESEYGYTVSIWSQTLVLSTQPGLFSPRSPDDGTLAMLDKVQLQPEDRVLDLGCGNGLVGLAVAARIGPRSVVLLDIDPLATRTTRLNAAANRLDEVEIITGDGPAAVLPRHFTLILCNPPYHTDFSVAKRLLEQSFNQLDPGGRLYLVVKRLTWYRNKLAGLFGGVTVMPVNGYFVLLAVKRDRKAVPKALPTTRKHTQKLAQSAQKKSRRTYKKGEAS